MSEVVNPYIAGNPVTGTEMFFGRQDVFAFIREALTGRHRDNVIVLYGQRRTGKTSVLYQMSRHLDAHYLCIFIDLHGLALEGLGGFVWELANHIQRTLRREHQIELPRLDRADFMADPRSAFENDFLNLVWSAIGDRHILLMLDEAIRLQEQVQAGKLERDIFDYLRHLMQHHERLNFLFSLGSGLEEMEKEYAFLFSVGLYKKISFLEPDAAVALITQPVKDCYQVEPAAVERILRVTSGHAYYTQLLCHSLFNRWQQLRQPQVRVGDVNATLDEVVERGLAVLKHVWEESTPGEKAILAGMAGCMGNHNRPVGLGEISNLWARHGVTLPEGEKAKAVKSLMARDVIVGQDRYAFTVDLQRLWVLKYERLDWVKEEIADKLAQWKTQYGIPATPRSLWRTKTVWAGTALVFGVVVTLIILVYQFLFFERHLITSLRAEGTRSAQQLQTVIANATDSARDLATAVAVATTAANASGPTADAAEMRLLGAQATATAVKLSLEQRLSPEPLAPATPTSTPRPGDTPSPSLTPTPCLDASEFAGDVTVPDGTRLEPGQVFTKTWRIKNIGTCIWGSDYELHFVDGDPMGGPVSIKLSGPARNGETVEVSVQLKAPQEAGSYQSQWQLRDAQGQPFGTKPYISILVSPTLTPTPGFIPIVISTEPQYLLNFASQAIWTNGEGVGGLWLDSYPDASNAQAPLGFAALVPSDRILASGKAVGSQAILATHPQFVPNGEIKGSFLLKLPPRGAEFAATLEFLSGATQSDGVHVQVWWLDVSQGASLGMKLAEANVGPKSPPVNLSADLSQFGEQTGQLQLVISAGKTSGEDWLTWRDMQVIPK